MLSTHRCNCQDVHFPPRKIPLSPDPHGPAHSPLSPLTPTSPLHPDGLISPIWVRKHTTLVPSVFVLFIRLYESPPHHVPRSPLDASHTDRDAEERQKDAEMSAEIASRKKSTSERGIKLTVVLMASRKMLGGSPPN
jgi:trafficking protein particle complex subunit 11